MDSKELRIGNLFEWSIFASMGKGISEVTLKNLGYHSLMEPIPLTEEWYDKIKDNTHEGVCLSNRDSKFYIVIDAGDFEAVWVEIKFVHKAQNLWYELTEGEELTIKADE